MPATYRDLFLHRRYAEPISLPLFLRKANRDLANSPCRTIYGQHAGKNYKRLAESGHRRRIVGNNEVSVAELINQVLRLDRYRCAPDSIEVGLVHVDFGARDGGFRNVSVEFDVPACKLAPGFNSYVASLTHSDPSGRSTRTVICPYSTPSGCLGPSIKGILKTLPPEAVLRSTLAALVFHPMVNGYFQPPKIG